MKSLQLPLNERISIRLDQKKLALTNTVDQKPLQLKENEIINSKVINLKRKGPQRNSDFEDEQKQKIKKRKVTFDFKF